MKKSFYLITAFLIPLVFLLFYLQEKPQSKPKVSLRFERAFKIDIGDSIGNTPSNLECFKYAYIKGNKDFIFQGYQAKSASIIQYTINESKPVLTIKNEVNLDLTKNQKANLFRGSRVGQIGNVYILYNPHTNFMFLFDSLGNKKFEINPDSQLPNKQFLLNAYYSFPYWEGKIPFCSYYNEGIDSNYAKKHFGLLLSKDQNSDYSIDAMKIKFPKDYAENGFFGTPHFFLSMTPTGNICCNFQSNDSLFIYDQLGQNLIQKAYAGSKVKHKFKPFKLSSSIAKVNAYHKNSSAYFKVVYDPFRKLYYRLFKHPQQEDPSSIKLKSSISWSIIILDQNFIKIGEHIFSTESKTELPMQVIPSPDGLWLSNTSWKDLQINKRMEMNLYKIEGLPK